MKRSFRDPYGGWWDAQEKRNFGEPVHEDNEVLGVFSPEQYTHVSARKGFFQLGAFVVTFLGLCGVVSMYYPDKPSVPKTYVDGLEKELGGANAVPVCSSYITPLVTGYYELQTSKLTFLTRLASPVRTSGDSHLRFFLLCVNTSTNCFFYAASLEGLMVNRPRKCFWLFDTC